MLKAISYIKIIRVNNAIITSIAILTGVWLSGGVPTSIQSVLLAIIGFCIVGFGNIINDIKDIKTDKISHPQRPLPMGYLTKTEAGIWAIFFLSAGLFLSYIVSWLHFISVIIPIILLIIYAKFLKGIPLLGNIIVSLLVAYAIIFGGIKSPNISALIFPAILAFILNLIREIVKDFQDIKGDKNACIKTSASINDNIIKNLVLVCFIIYLIIMPLPTITGSFGQLYLLTSILFLIPIHTYWFYYFLQKDWKNNSGKISKILKLEMIIGLMILILDKSISYYN